MSYERVFLGSSILCIACLLQDPGSRTARGREDQQTIAAMMAVISDLQHRIAMLEARGISPRVGSDTNQQISSRREEKQERPEQQLQMHELQEQLRETSLASERLLCSRADPRVPQGRIPKLSLFSSLLATSRHSVQLRLFLAQCLMSGSTCDADQSLIQYRNATEVLGSFPT